MRALYTSRHGGPEVLEVRESPTPKPQRGEILVAVQRAGLNFADISARMGLYPEAPKPPMVVGYEWAGTVEALGEGVNGPPVGARVFGFKRFGGHSSHVCVPESQVMLMPAKMSFDEAAAIPVVYLTAFHMLFYVGHLRPHDKLLIHAAAGGVGLAVIQLAQLGEGVEIFGTASAKKHELLRSLGVAHCIDYGTQDFEEEIRRITNGRGVNMALDAVGGKNWTKSFNSLSRSGHLICFGWSAMADGETRDVFHVAAELVKMRWWNGLNLMKENKTISGVNMGGLWDEVGLLRSHMMTLVKLYSEGKIKPHVDQVFPISKGADAHRYMQERRNVGKVVLDTTA